MKRSTPSLCVFLASFLASLSLTACSSDSPGSPELPEAENLLQDPGFEESVPDGTFPSSGYWEPAWAVGEAGAVCTSTAARQENAGLWEYTGVGGSEWWAGTCQDIAAQPGDVFTASAWVKSQSEWVEGSKALVRIVFLNGLGAPLAQTDSPAVSAALSGWSELTVQSPPAPQGTVTVRYRLYLEKPAGSEGQSVANFDDCVLKKSSAPSLDRRLLPGALGFGNDLSRLTLSVRNSGGGTLTWNVVKDRPWIRVNPAAGSTTLETDEIEVTVDRSGLAGAAYSGLVTLNSNGGSEAIDVYMEPVPAGSVPAQASLVQTDGRRLLVACRLPDGSLDESRPYTIRGAVWSPARVGNTGAHYERRNDFGNWYRLDIQMLRMMNANTVYLFLDPGTDPTMIDGALRILDYCYWNGIMVIMTADENGSDNQANIAQVVAAFREHPAILMWALGNEWNLLRGDRQEYYGHYDTFDEAAMAMQANSLLIKSLDGSHPVCSILGEINLPSQPEVTAIVQGVCLAVDVWGANIYRGPEFYELFDEWGGMSSKPLFLSEFGTDAFRTTNWWPPAGYEDQQMQAGFVHSLWADLAQELSAKDPARVCLGGTVFEFNDEWWKSSRGEPEVQEPHGYETAWNPTAHPDGFANEEWFGIVSIDRKRRAAYFLLQQDFGAVPDSAKLLP